MTTMKEIEDKIININEQPKEEKNNNFSKKQYNLAKKVIKDASRQINYRISWDYPKVLRILDKTSSIKVAEFRPTKVKFYNTHLVFKQRLLSKIRSMDKFNKKEKEQTISYIKGN